MDNFGHAPECTFCKRLPCLNDQLDFLAVTSGEKNVENKGKRFECYRKSALALGYFKKRTPLPFCVEERIKSNYPDSDPEPEQQSESEHDEE
jgi:hypothetical protein